VKKYLLDNQAIEEETVRQFITESISLFNKKPGSVDDLLYGRIQCPWNMWILV
jgi:hypothetical protein